MRKAPSVSTLRSSALALLTVALVGYSGPNAATGDEPRVVDAAYKDACGPFACTVALNSLGVDASLQQVGARCRWKEGEPVKLSSLEQTLNSYTGVECRSASLTPDELCDVLQDDFTVVILALRKNSDQVNHAVCATGADPSAKTVEWIDYPEFRQRKHVTEIAEAWDGAALVVRRTPFIRCIYMFGLVFGPALSLFYLGKTLSNMRRTQDRPSTGTAA